jgi:WD40 repeat protein
VSFSRDGSKIVAASEDGAQVFETDTGAVLAHCDYRVDSVTSVLFSPDDARVTVRGYLGKVHAFNAETGEQLSQVDHAGGGRQVVFSADGAKVATNVPADGVRVLDPAVGESVRLDCDMEAFSVKFSPDGAKVAAAGNDTVRIFDATAGAQLACVDYGCAMELAFSPNGAKFAIRGYDGIVQIFDTVTGTELSRLDQSAAAPPVVFSPDGTKVATGTRDCSVRVFDVTTGTELSRLDHNTEVYPVVFSPDGTKIATGSHDGTARVWIIDRHQLIEQAAGRLARNLSPQEWRLYFRGDPYRKIRVDLPLSRAAGASAASDSVGQVPATHKQISRAAA